MESFLVRYRNLLVLLSILLAQIIGLATQVRRTGEGHNTLDAGDLPSVRLIRLWANALVSPPEQMIHSTKMGAGWLWQNYIDLRNVRQQNGDLQKTIDRLRLEQAALLEDARQGERLQGLLKFQEKYIYKTVAAQAIGSSGSEQSRVVYIDKGSADGLARDMAVITPEGIVGKVRDVFPHTAQVLAINDQTSGAGVILETTRIRGILRGNANGQPQIVDILADKRIQKGESVLTAGGDDIFPRGLAVGVVDQVVPDPDRDGFINITVTPAAHLDRLDEVLIITSTEPRFSEQQQQDIATSETEKKQEAAALAEQRKASEIMAERLPGLIDPNLPHDEQPLYDSSNPIQVARPPQALHPDRFTPGAVAAAAGAFSGDDSSVEKQKTTPEADSAPGADSATPPPAKPQPRPASPVKPAGTAAESKPNRSTGVESQPPAPPQDQPRRNP